MTKEEFTKKLEAETLALDELLDKAMYHGLFPEPGVLRAMDQSIGNLEWVAWMVNNGPL